MLGKSLHWVPPGHFWSSGTSLFLLRGTQRSIVYVVFVQLAEFSTLWSTDLGPPSGLNVKPAPSAWTWSHRRGTFAEARNGKSIVDRIAAWARLRGNRMINSWTRAPEQSCWWSAAAQYVRIQMKKCEKEWRKGEFSWSKMTVVDGVVSCSLIVLLGWRRTEWSGSSWGIHATLKLTGEKTPRLFLASEGVIQHVIMASYLSWDPFLVLLLDIWYFTQSISQN